MVKFPKTKHFRCGSCFASLEANRFGYTITYSRNGKVVGGSTYYVRDGWNRSVGRTEALRELKRQNYKEIKNEV